MSHERLFNILANRTFHVDMTRIQTPKLSNEKQMMNFNVSAKRKTPEHDQIRSSACMAFEMTILAPKY